MYGWFEGLGIMSQSLLPTASTASSRRQGEFRVDGEPRRQVVQQLFRYLSAGRVTIGQAEGIEEEVSPRGAGDG